MNITPEGRRNTEALTEGPRQGWQRAHSRLSSVQRQQATSLSTWPQGPSGSEKKVKHEVSSDFEVVPKEDGSEFRAKHPDIRDS